MQSRPLIHRLARFAAPAVLLLALAFGGAARAQSMPPAAASTSQNLAPLGLVEPSTAIETEGNVYDESDALSPALTQEFLVIAALLAVAGIGILRPRPLSWIVNRATAPARRRLAYVRLAARRSATARQLALAKKETPVSHGSVAQDITPPRSRVRTMISRAITN